MKAKLVYTNGKVYTLTGARIKAMPNKTGVKFVVEKHATAIGGGVKVQPQEHISVNHSDLMGYQIKDSRKASTNTVCVSRSRLSELNRILAA